MVNPHAGDKTDPEADERKAQQFRRKGEHETAAALELSAATKRKWAEQEGAKE